MTAVCGAIRLSNDDMRMNFGLTPIERNIADEREHLYLFGDRNAFVVLFVPIEIAERHFLKGSDCGEMAGAQPLFLGEGSQSRRHFVSGFKDHRVCVRLRIDSARFHSIPSAARFFTAAQSAFLLAFGCRWIRRY